MKPTALYSHVVDVSEALVEFTWVVRGRSAYLTEDSMELGEGHSEATLPEPSFIV